MKSNLEDKLALAKKMAEKIAMKNNQKGAIQQSTESYLSGKGGSGGQPTLTAKTVADHLAKRLNAKLNYQPTEESADTGNLLMELAGFPVNKLESFLFAYESK